MVGHVDGSALQRARDVGVVQHVLQSDVRVAAELQLVAQLLEVNAGRREGHAEDTTAAAPVIHSRRHSVPGSSIVQPPMNTAAKTMTHSEGRAGSGR